MPRRAWGQRACDRRAHLEAVDGEEPAEDALLEPRAQHDHVVLLIHGCPARWLLRRRRRAEEEVDAA